MPHNITLAEGVGWVTRKDCAGRTIDFCDRHPKGAVRGRSRFEIGRSGADKTHAALG
ncbi:hypothetical protein QUB63_30520 [Microcoleus sp. ARI1-B5]|uniref:hypothetical protein n=1 Tax=unclassified Microcoleus TaxID=2642155 RepID=UPI002FD732D1